MPSTAKSSLNSTIPKITKNAERISTLTKNHNVSLTTHATFKPRVIGVTKKSIMVNDFETQRRISLWSTIQFPKNTFRVRSGATSVI